MEKKNVFKYLIKEFHEASFPSFFERDFHLPKTQKIITIIGSRRVGKTFYCYQLMKKLRETVQKERILYINFEDDRLFPLHVGDLDEILEAYYELYPDLKGKELYLFFDEIQNIPSWELYVRRVYDKERIRIVITGSNAKLLSREIATSLRGRTITFSLFPLSFKEFLQFNGLKITQGSLYSKERFFIKKSFEKYMTLGGFPEIVLEKNNLEQKILREYFEMVLYRDILGRFSIRNVTLLKMLSKFLLTNVSASFSINAYYNSIKQTIALSKDSIAEYVSYLEEANMIFLVSLFDYSLKKQQAAPKKVYCIDNGLRNAVSFLFSKDERRLAENLVFIELKRREKDIFYWKKQGEVDFLIKEDDETMVAINVSYGDSIDEREVRSLKEVKALFGKKLKEMLIITKDTEKKEQDITFIPLYKWFL
jgi:predicted AAA+ superfamily ATPase